MDAGATNADKYAEVPAGPARVFVPLAVGAYFVGLQLEKTLDGLLVLGCPFGSRIRWPPRHGPRPADTKAVVATENAIEDEGELGELGGGKGLPASD